ncbi:MAG: beta-lactamase family protein [Acidobacteria bacterium]|nr:beta-lactamase family protein [Acidobacteriota bacterium]
MMLLGGNRRIRLAVGSSAQDELHQERRDRAQKRGIVWLICLCLTLAVSGAAAGQARADEIDEYVMEQMRRQHIPGLSLAVLKDGKPVKLKGYGVANLELNVPTTPETVYKIGSLSKQFIAAGIMLLNKEGRIGLGAC